jgi:hypothetical protein
VAAGSASHGAFVGDARAEMEGALGVETTSYLYSWPVKGSAANDNVFSSVNGRFQADGVAPWIQAHAEGEGQVYLNGDHPVSFEIPEAYIATSPDLSRSVQASFGRKKEQWSRLDEQWALGVWEPRYRWDYLRPELVGLTGFFLETKSPLFSIQAFATPLFIPERGFSTDVRQGELSAPSRWFVPPPGWVSVFDIPTPVRYGLALPDLQKIVLNPGGSIRGKLGGDRGPWLAGGWGLLPMNQFLLGLEAYLSVAGGQQQIQAEIYPRVVYHQLASFEAGMVSDSVDFWVSVLSERPIRDSTPSGWITQEVSDSLSVSPGISWKLEDLPESQAPAKIGMSYLWQRGGNAPDAGDRIGISSAGSLFEKRYLFQDAVRFEGRTPLPGPWKRRLLGSSSVLYDMDRTGMIVSGDVRYTARERWVLGVGADILATSGRTGEQSDDFINKYRADHRVHAGVSYVF